MMTGVWVRTGCPVDRPALRKWSVTTLDWPAASCVSYVPTGYPVSVVECTAESAPLTADPVNKLPGGAYTETVVRTLPGGTP